MGIDFLFPLIAAAIWGGNTVVNKLAAGAIGPAEIGFYRWVLAALLLTPFVWRGLWANRRMVRAAFWQLAALGLLGGTIFQCLAYFAAALTSAINMGIIQALVPLLAIGLTSLWLGQRATWGALAGAGVSLAGVACVVSRGHPASLLAHGLNGGDLMMLIGTAAYACYTVLLKRWRPALPLAQSLYVQAVVAAAALLPLYLALPRTGLSAANAPLVAYAAIAASVVAPLVWMHGVNRLGPSRTALFFNLVPLFSVVFAACLLGERLTVYHLVGGALTLGGVTMAELWKTPVGRALPAAPNDPPRARASRPSAP